MTTRITTSNIDPTALIAIQGPIISSIQVTSNNYVVLDDTAVDTAGGFIRINGSNFTSSTQVIIGSQLATSVTFVNSSTLNVQVPAQSAGTYTVYVTNNNGDVAIMVMGVTYSPIPAWSTGSTLPGGVVNSSLSIQLNASGDGSITYAVANGSSLPPGLTLSSNGLLSGAVTGITSETTYNFNINAIDAQLQDAPRTFSITILANDPNLRNTTTLLSASNPSSTFVSDASANSFVITVNGDVRPSNFGPYTPGYYSGSFSSGGISWPGSAALALGTGDFTIECWVNYTSEASRFLTNRVSFSAGSGTWSWSFNSTSIAFVTVIPGEPGVSNSSVSIPTNRWNHLAVVRSSGVITFYVNGTSFAGGSFGYDLGNTDQSYLLGSTSEKNGFNFTGSISNLRILKGTALYTSSFTPSTTPLTAVANTQLLICQSNRFRDESNNNVALTPSSATITGFDPFVPSASFAGRGSGFFDGTGDYLNFTGGTATTIGTSSGTVEFWMYATANDGYRRIIASTSGGFASGTFVIRFNQGSFLVGAGGGNSITATLPVTNRWYHIAWVGVNGSSQTLYIDGVSAGTAGSYDLTESISLIGGWYSVSTSEFFAGYLSDVRIVKGTAVYTTNFTPPTAPLTAIANTSLLTLQNNQPNNNSMFLDNSTNNFNITRNGNVTQGTFSPYGGGWSNYFDGSTTYLNTSSSANLGFGTGDFTVEFFIYPTATPSTCSLYHGSTTNSFIINTTSDGRLVIRQYGIADLFTSAAALSLNTWNHVAVARSGTTISLWLNGSRSSGVTGTNSTNWATTAVYIGRADSVTNIVQGYISNVRAVKGTAIYNPANATITVPTTPLTPVSGTSLLTCADNRFIDDSANNLTITRNGSPTVQRFNPFSPTITTPTSYSAFFDGTGDWLSGIGTVSSFNFMHNTSALFTIEAWVYTGTTGAQQTIACTNGVAASASVGFWFVIETDNTLRLFVTKGSAGNPVINAVSSGTVPLNSWTHVAVTYNQSLASNNATFYINGVLSGTATKTANAPVDSNAGNALNIGSFQGGGTYMVGYISNLRITNSIVYTGAFTPSATPLTAVANTALLTCQSDTLIDNSTNNFTITNNGDTAPRQFNPFGWTNITSSSAAYTPALYGGSGYLDGSGDYLELSAQPNLYLNSSTYTIECWVYFTRSPGTANAGTLQAAITQGDGAWFGSANEHNWYLLFEPSQVNFGKQPTAYVASYTPALNVWTHVAIVGNAAGTITMYINGVSLGTQTSRSALGSASWPTRIGLGFYGDSKVANYFQGYITDVRITKGTARYNSNFQPPIAPLTALQNTVLLNNMTSAGIYDSGMITTYETVGNVSINTSVKKYGNTSMYFDGTGDYLISTDGPFVEPGNASLTWEMWINTTSATQYATLYSRTPAGFATGMWSLMINLASSTSGDVGLYVADANPSAPLLQTTGVNIRDGSWHHIAVVRNGSSWVLYVDGISRATATWSGTVANIAGTPYVGADQAYGRNYLGYMGDLRITNGIARYTANFTPPTAPFIQF